ncbi:MAG: Crp/Fnr family transcriptional regulator [Rubrivivax sp.]|nr:Crp/Fnr family transcriptional regulator [Rubrivivax sp.]
MTIASALSFAERGRFSQLRAFAGDMLYTEGMPAPHLYVVKEGVVDLFLVREDKRTVIETLRRGQCFGIEPHLAQPVRMHNAAASSYCELYVIDAAAVHGAVAESAELTQGMLNTLSQRLSAAHEVIAQRVNYQPELLVYADLLHLLGMADLGRQAGGAGGAARSGHRAHGHGHGHGHQHGHHSGHLHGHVPGGPLMARPTLQEVLNHARLLLGHSDRHARSLLARLHSLHLIRYEDEKGQGKQVVFAPRDIVAQARKIVAEETQGERQSHQYVGLDEFAALVDVDRGVLLRKLAAGEFAEDVFTFRRAEILRVLDAKGRRYFSDRKLKPPQEFSDISDVEFADTRSIFEAVSRVDAYDLAKVVQAMGEGEARQKILAALSARRREEVESELRDMATFDEVQAQRLGAELIAHVKAAMLQKAA